MGATELVGRLRRFRFWSKARAARHSFGPVIAGIVHSIVLTLGPRLVPKNLWLKHTFDYMTLHVDPQRITRHVKVAGWRWSPSSRSLMGKIRSWYRLGDGWKSVKTNITRNFHGRFVADGDWDRYAESFDVLPVVSQLFEEGRLPGETDEYQRYLKRINDGQLTWTKGLKNQQDLDRYYDALVQAYEDIKTSGYRTQMELGESGVDEIRVCIDRDGTVCVLGGGTHRLSIARLLGLETVPVILKRVHSAWIESIDAESGSVTNAIEQELRSVGIMPHEPADPETIEP